MKLKCITLYVVILGIIFVSCGGQNPNHGSSQVQQSPSERCAAVRDTGASRWATYLNHFPDDLYGIRARSQSGLISALGRIVGSARTTGSMTGASSGVEGISTPQVYCCPVSGQEFQMQVSSDRVVLKCPTHGESVAYR